MDRRYSDSDVLFHSTLDSKPVKGKKQTNNKTKTNLLSILEKSYPFKNEFENQAINSKTTPECIHYYRVGFAC